MTNLGVAAVATLQPQIEACLDEEFGSGSNGYIAAADRGCALARHW